MPDTDRSGTRILQAAVDMAPRIRACADEIEQGRRLPTHLVAEMRRVGVFGMAMPTAWGGPELDFPTQLRVIEALSIADASVGWCTMIGVDGGFMTAYLDQSVAREMYPDLNVSTAITFALTGKAVKEKNGYRVNGRWQFGSGCQHADWIIGHFAVFDGDRPVMQPNGTPETRFGFLPPHECEIHDTWHTTGLCGSGSHDWSVTDRFIPEERTANLQNPVVHRDGPLYRLPNLLLYKTSAVALGIAKGAIDDFTSMAIEKALTFSTSTAKKLRDEAYAQTALAQAEALVSSARGFVNETIGDIWSTLTAGNRPSLKQRARGRLAMAHASSSCAQAVDLLYKSNGGASVYARNHFDRRLRDIHTINQHAVVSLKTWEVAGRVMLGLEPNHGLLF